MSLKTWCQLWCGGGSAREFRMLDDNNRGNAKVKVDVREDTKE